MATQFHGTASPAAPQPRVERGSPEARLEPGCNAAEAPRLFGLVCDEPLIEVTIPAPAPAALWSDLVPASSETLLDARHRAFDMILALGFIALLLPVMMVAAALVLLSSHGPIIFRHERVGRNGKPFLCLKFRTMEHQAEELLPSLLDADGAARSEWLSLHKIRSDPRVTPVGRTMRRFSIDELPQLFNVLRGDMSIVGPRPIVEAEIERYGQDYRHYCSVRPGLTGLWQVSGRNDVSYERRVELDCEYARSKSLRNDVWLILRTVPVVIHGNGL